MNILFIKYLKDYDYEFKKTFWFKNLSNTYFDCLIFGNSSAFDGLDAEYLSQKGLSSFNMALDGASIKSNYIQLDHYLKSNKKPKLVILGLSSRMSHLLGREGVQPIVAYNYDLLNIFSLRNMPMIKFQWLLIKAFKKIVIKEYREAKIVLGQLKLNRVFPDNTKYSSNFFKALDKDFYKKDKYLLKIDSLCQINGIAFYALTMPGKKDKQNDYAEGIDSIKYQDEITLKIINLNNREFVNRIINSDRDWLKGSHLNEYGAKKLTEHLYEYYLKKYNSN